MEISKFWWFHGGGGFKMNFLIFLRNSLDTDSKVHSFCELLLTLLDKIWLDFSNFQEIVVFFTWKFTKKLPAALSILKRFHIFVFVGIFDTFAEICQLKKTKKSDSLKNQAETSHFQVYLVIAQHWPKSSQI